jgi:hypothetical protein
MGLLILYFSVYLCVPFYLGLGHEFHKEGRVVISFPLNFVLVPVWLNDSEKCQKCFM